MRRALAGVLALASVVVAPGVQATTRTVDLTAAHAQAAAGAIAAYAEVLVRGLSPAGREVINTIAFTPGVAAVRVNTSWVVGELGAGFRLLGLNVDLLDGTGNVVASDDFQGLLAGTALSTLTADGLVPGTRYRLRLTATAIGRGSYAMTIRGVPPTP